MQAKIGDSILVCGNAARDAEFKTVGEKHTPVCKFSLAVGKAKDTTTIFINCQAWRDKAEYCAQIQKGDTVFAIGTLEEKEYKGKVYKTLNCDFVQIQQRGEQQEQGTPEGFTPADNPDDLPF